MLPKHVEGSGSRYILSELQRLPEAPGSNSGDRCIVYPADLSEPARESQEHQHRAEDCPNRDPRRRSEQQRRRFHADPAIVLPVLKRIDRIVSDCPENRRRKQAPGRRFNVSTRSGPGHDSAPAERDTQHRLRDMDDAFRKGIEAGQEDGDRTQENRKRVEEQHEHTSHREEEAEYQQGMCQAQFTRRERPSPCACDMPIEGSIR